MLNLVGGPSLRVMGLTSNLCGLFGQSALVAATGAKKGLFSRGLCPDGSVVQFYYDCNCRERVGCHVHVVRNSHSQMSLNSSQTGQLQSVQQCFHNGNVKDLVLWCRNAFSFGFFPFFFYKQMLLSVVGGGGFHDNWDFGSQEILSSFRTFTNEAERTLDLPRRQSCQATSPWLST